MNVTVAVYAHRYGQDVRVFKTRESALKWADEIADEYWEHMTDNAPRTENWREEYWQIAAETYHTESFTLESMPVEE